MSFQRRKALRAAVQLAVASVFSGRIGRVSAGAEETQAAIDVFTDGVVPARGTVTLTLPEIAENGNTVSMSVSVESPMTEDSYVESVAVVAEDNPNPEVVTFHFSPSSGVARASTRMRLAKTQKVIAVARMNDGSVYTDSRIVKVTIGGCGG